jgi:hypothetical protein
MIGRMINSGKSIAGLNGAATAATGVNALGTSIRTLSGAGAAAIGLTALGGAILAISSVAGLIVGMADNAREAARDPKFAQLLHWANSGANRVYPRRMDRSHKTLTSLVVRYRK